ncbi:DUF1499 domain-containing protein [Chachezhania antarctica]|uniref:DUF1499 domain-containing protein n=1 Tax=Chachezhania antarctica TaxID=2340860 RepID=UPI0013CE55DB|nr:DUF1499 domain-containing protein [Chachezhania antarctica]
MRTILMILFVVIVLAVVGAGYIRLAPSDPARWNVRLEFTSDEDLPDGVKRIVETGPDGLARLDRIAMDTPRTERLAGSVEDGRITWITRTKVMGFPDYTTAQQDGDMLKIWGRLRFGASDMGVNRARVDGWIDRLDL